MLCPLISARNIFLGVNFSLAAIGNETLRVFCIRPRNPACQTGDRKNVSILEAMNILHCRKTTEIHDNTHVCACLFFLVSQMLKSKGSVPDPRRKCIFPSLLVWLRNENLYSPDILIYDQSRHCIFGKLVPGFSHPVCVPCSPTVAAGNVLFKIKGSPFWLGPVAWGGEEGLLLPTLHFQMLKQHPAGSYLHPFGAAAAPYWGLHFMWLQHVQVLCSQA